MIFKKAKLIKALINDLEQDYKELDYKQDKNAFQSTISDLKEELKLVQKLDIYCILLLISSFVGLFCLGFYDNSTIKIICYFVAIISCQGIILSSPVNPKTKLMFWGVILVNASNLLYELLTI